jgi:glycolate oxidase iron-sulfur subunit
VAKKLRVVEQEILRCSRCGKCRSVCPVFTESLVESQVARGKIALAEAALEERLDVSRVLSDRMTLCLNCKSCVTNCPAEVRTDEIVLAARDHLHEKGKSPFLKRAFIDHVWAKGRVFARFVQTASQIQPLLFKKGTGGAGVSRIPLVGVDPERRVPLFESKSLLSSVPEVVLPDGTSRMRVALFVGCATNWVYPGIGESVIEVLRGSGVEIVIPRGQECCGVPMLNAGDFDNARKQMEKNRVAFARHGYDAVVTACASCGLALKKEMDEILEAGEYFPKVPVYDFSEFLSEVSDLSDGSDPTDPSDRPLRVTYHDPCHLNRGQGIVSQPREILRSIPGVELVEMPEADRCCGGGGLFSLSHYDVAQKIGARKAEAIAATGASAVATSCPACMIQLTDSIARAGLDVRVVHVAELLRERQRVTSNE